MEQAILQELRRRAARRERRTRERGMLTDEALLASATREHDRDAMADFFERHQLSVYRTCLGVLRRPDLAEDATQETFLSVIRQGSTVRPDGSVRGWLHRVAMNASLQVLRSERRRGRRELRAGMERLQSASADAERDLPAVALDGASLRHQLHLLVARWRVPIVLRYEEGLSYKEIAEVLRVSEGTVGSRIHRGLALLRDALGPAAAAVSTPDLEQAITQLPPRKLPEPLETSLHALLGRLSAAVPPEVGPLPRPAGRGLFFLAVALAIAGMLALTGWFLLPGFVELRPGGGGPQVAPAQLSFRIQGALDAFDAALRGRFRDPTQSGRTSALLAELDSPNALPPAHQDKPAIARLASILTECQRRQPGYAEMNWKELEQRAIDLRNYPTFGKLADKLVAWARAEDTAQGHMGDGKDYLRSNRPDEGFSTYKKIDPESVYFQEAANRMLELKGILTDRTVRVANQSVRSGDFRSALDEIHRVLNLFEARYPDVLVALRPIEKECEKNLEYQNLLDEAETLIARKRLDDAEQRLAAVDLGAPPSVLTRVGKLRETIGVQGVMIAANERYRNGDGKAALQILIDRTHPDLVKLRTRIQQVVDATTAAQNAIAQNLFDEAQRHWGEVLGLEPDESNRYRQEATKQVGAGPSFQDAANREYQKGYEAQQAGQLGEAREHYEKAMQLYPNHEESVAAIKAFVRDVQKTYNFDKMAFQRGQMTLDVIIPKWEDILSFLRPQDGGVYTMFAEGLQKLRTTGGF